MKFAFAFILSVAVTLLTQCAPQLTQEKPIKESYAGILPGIRAPQTLTSGGQVYRAKYSALTAQGLLVEYFKSDEGPKNWSSMLAVRTIETSTTPKDQTRTMAKFLDSSGHRYASYSNDSKGETGIDFILDKNRRVEFNVFRYSSLKGSQGVQSLQFAEILSPDKVNVNNVRQLNAERRAQVFKINMPYISRQ